MIEFATGNLLKADADDLVNCVGVMGRGTALQFKNGFEALREGGWLPAGTAT